MIRLESLVAPLPVEQFMEDHWSPGVPWLAKAGAPCLELLLAMDGLQGIGSLLPKLKRPVALFGPNQFRSSVPPSSARDFLESGYNLYITHVEQVLPEVSGLFQGLARDLGVAPWQLYLEVFAGMPGGVSSRHYDHDINFQILLKGEKSWRMEENRHIRNPLRSFHPKRVANGDLSGFSEEAFAEHRDLPLDFEPGRVKEVHATAGTVMFIPRGHWHEVTSLTETFSLNVVVKGQTWASALGAALVERLHWDPALRRYCDNLPYAGAARSRTDEDFAKFIRAAHAALDELTPLEAALSGDSRHFRWSERARRREVTVHQGQAQLVVPGVLEEPLPMDEALAPVLRAWVAFKQPFTRSAALAVASGMKMAEVHNLLNDLSDLGVLEQTTVQAAAGE